MKTDKPRPTDLPAPTVPLPSRPWEDRANPESPRRPDEAARSVDRELAAWLGSAIQRV